jgi:hypothetical protein
LREFGVGEEELREERGEYVVSSGVKKKQKERI